MNTWKLAAKMWLLLGISWLVGIGASGYLLNNLRVTTASFEALLRGEQCDSESGPAHTGGL